MLAIYNKLNYYQYDDESETDSDSYSMRLNMWVKHRGSRKNTFSFELYALCNCYWQISKANTEILICRLVSEMKWNLYAVFIIDFRHFFRCVLLTILSTDLSTNLKCPHKSTHTVSATHLHMLNVRKTFIICRNSWTWQCLDIQYRDRITSFMSCFGNEPYTFAINYTSKYARWQRDTHTTYKKRACSFASIMLGLKFNRLLFRDFDMKLINSAQNSRHCSFFSEACLVSFRPKSHR